jgi:hypothetical protein
MYIILLFSIENGCWHEKMKLLPVGSNDLKVASVLQVMAGMLIGFSKYIFTDTERELLVYGLCVTFKILVSACHTFCDSGNDY